ncbi:MAG: hypothetical protein KGH75_01410 [Rhodospirillales bacterium]|nr:hypothetical protein [Rhodospirillales bacterium]
MNKQIEIQGWSPKGSLLSTTKITYDSSKTYKESDWYNTLVLGKPELDIAFYRFVLHEYDDQNKEISLTWLGTSICETHEIWRSRYTLSSCLWYYEAGGDMIDIATGKVSLIGNF